MTDPLQVVPRSRAAIGTLWAVVVIDVAAVGSGVPYLRYLQSLDPEAAIADLDFVASELVYALVGLAQFVSLLVAVVFFIRWFQVAYANVETLSGRATTHNPGWAIWGFLSRS